MWQPLLYKYWYSFCLAWCYSRVKTKLLMFFAIFPPKKITSVQYIYCSGLIARVNMEERHIWASCARTWKNQRFICKTFFIYRLCIYSEVHKLVSVHFLAYIITVFYCWYMFFICCEAWYVLVELVQMCIMKK